MNKLCKLCEHKIRDRSRDVDVKILHGRHCGKDGRVSEGPLDFGPLDNTIYLSSKDYNFSQIIVSSLNLYNTNV